MKLTEDTPIGLSQDGCISYHLGDMEFKDVMNQILENQAKANLFDSLQIENKTMLDTISQLRIANGMYKRENQNITHSNFNFTITNETLRDEIKQLKDQLIKCNNVLEKYIKDKS